MTWDAFQACKAASEVIRGQDEPQQSSSREEDLSKYILAHLANPWVLFLSPALFH